VACVGLYSKQWVGRGKASHSQISFRKLSVRITVRDKDVPRRSYYTIIHLFFIFLEKIIVFLCKYYYSKVYIIRYSLLKIILLYVFFFPGGHTIQFLTYSLLSFSLIRIFPSSVWKTYKRDFNVYFTFELGV